MEGKEREKRRQEREREGKETARGKERAAKINVYGAGLPLAKGNATIYGLHRIVGRRNF